MIPEKVLIVDGNAICYSAFYSAGHLKDKDDNGTGVIYGFFSQLQLVCRSQQIAHIVFCWDSRKSLRKRIYPEYKESRNKKDPALVEAFAQFNQIRDDILPRLGFANSFKTTGYEADDIIASICRFPGPTNNQHYVIMSGDQDLYQLLTDHVSMYHPAKKKIYTKYNFVQEFGIDPLFWATVKALAGCPSDSVAGIPSIGPKRAIAYIKDHHSGQHPVIDTAEGRAILERNKRLVTLPFARTPLYALKWDENPSYAEFIALCEELGFLSFLRSPETFERIFAGMPPADANSKIKINMGKRRKGLLD